MKKFVNSALAVAGVATLTLGGAGPALAAPQASVQAAPVMTVQAAKKGSNGHWTLKQARVAAWVVQSQMPLPARIFYVTNNRFKGQCAGGSSKYTHWYWQMNCVIQYSAPK